MALAETAATGATVFGILNPASGPGTVTDDTYPEIIDYVVSAGAKVGFGSLFYLFEVPCLSRRPRFRPWSLHESERALANPYQLDICTCTCAMSCVSFCTVRIIGGLSPQTPTMFICL